MSTRALAVRAPLPELPNLDGEIGRNPNSLPSVDVVRGVQLQYATLQEGDGLAFHLFRVGRRKESWSSEQIKASVQCPAQEYCGFRRRPNTSNCAYWSAPILGRPGIAGRTPLWTGCVLPVTGRELNRTGKFINDCLHCVDSGGGGKVPRPFGETTHRTEVNPCSPFYYLYIETGFEKVQQICKHETIQGVR